MTPFWRRRRPPPDPRFWRSLLERRRVSRWGNFSWISIGALLQSANDQIAKLIDSSIVNRRRGRWAEAQRARGIDLDEPVRLKGMRKLLVVGDPGEMDASQYVLLLDLYATQAQALLLMSDVVYPAGDVNAWRDAVYLPYFGLPRHDWQAAVTEWGENASVPEDLRPSPPDWHVFATPGNHDWYDGLNGFMFHACGAEPLADVAYSTAGLTRRQRISRRMWRRAARLSREPLEPLRQVSARRWDGLRGGGSTAAGPMPYQPGPYYMIDIAPGTSPNAEPASEAELEGNSLRMICVDNGIDGSIDVGQALWLGRALDDDRPKVVILGKPLVVDNKISSFRIDRGIWRHSADESFPPFDEDPLKEDREDLRDVLFEGTNVIATIGGDIHNAQRFVIGAEEPTGSRDDVRLRINGGDELSISAAIEEGRVPPINIVAGGGGAYLTETHRTGLDPDDGSLELKDKKRDSPAIDPLPEGRHWRYPSREQSVLLFAANVSRPAIAALAVALGAGVAVAAWSLGSIGSEFQGDVVLEAERRISIAPWRALVGGLALVGLIAAVAFAVITRPGGGVLRLVPALPFAALLCCSLATIENVGAVPILVGSAAAMAALPLLLVAAPLLRTFPGLRRLIPTRLITTAAGGGLTYLLVIEDVPVLRILGVLAVVGVLVWAILRGFRYLQRMSPVWALRKQHLPRRLALQLAAALWPIPVMAAAIWASGELPNEELGRLIRLIIVADLFVFLSAGAGFSLYSAARARAVAPKKALAVIALAALAGVLISTRFLEEYRLEVGPVEMVDPALALYFGAGASLAAIGVAVFISSCIPTESDVTKALQARDGGSSPPGRDLALFRAMLIAGLPGLGQLAESRDRPFYKSFLTIELGQKTTEASSELAVTFRTFGVKDEPTFNNDPGVPEDHGAYEVDKLEVTIPI